MDRSALYDHSMRPAAIAPESKKSMLYKSPAVFEKIDKRAVNVSICSVLYCNKKDILIKYIFSDRLTSSSYALF